MPQMNCVSPWISNALQGLVVSLVVATSGWACQQVADPDFKPTVANPAYTENGPVVAIDEAHKNFHTADDRFKPFADLLRADGFQVVANDKPFSRDALQGISILVIANAGVPSSADKVDPAFTNAECEAVRAWIESGGSLLFIADHAPFGSAAENLGKQLGVEMGKGWVFDRNAAGNFSTQLVFSLENNSLGDHSLLRGRDETEQIKTIRAFTGQSLSVPEGAVSLLRLSDNACEAADQKELGAAAEASELAKDKPLRESTAGHAVSVAGRSQGLVMELGKGRVAIMGEAAMFSAQVATLNDGNQQRQIKIGMNVEGYDNQQFALNLVRWLARVLK